MTVAEVLCESLNMLNTYITNSLAFFNNLLFKFHTLHNCFVPLPVYLSTDAQNAKISFPSLPSFILPQHFLSDFWKLVQIYFEPPKFPTLYSMNKMYLSLLQLTQFTV